LDQFANSSRIIKTISDGWETWCYWQLIPICWFAEWKPWGVPDDYECEVIENDAPVPKHIPIHRPGPLPEEFYKTMEAIGSKEGPSITAGGSKSKE